MQRKHSRPLQHKCSRPMQHKRSRPLRSHLGCQVVERAVAQRQMDLLRRHAADQRRCAQANDVSYLARHQRLKHDELVDTVDKLRPARVQQV